MLSFNKLEEDLGDVVFGSGKSFEIVATNNASEAASVYMTNSSCSCTTGAIYPNPVEAYATAVVKISFDSNKGGGRGLLSKAISATWTIAGQQHSQTFRFKVNVI